MEEKRRLTKKELRRRRRRRILIAKTVLLCGLLAVLGFGIWALSGGMSTLKEKAQEKNESQQTSSADSQASDSSISTAGEVDPSSLRESLMAEAEALAMTYDYDGAIEKLQSIEGASTDADIITKIAEYTSTRDACVRVNVNEVTHIFYHSLVVDPQKAFFQDNAQTEGFCEWMTTVDEFNKITQQMYDNGYVMVSIRDLVKETVDEDGNVHFTEGDIYLPEGKKAFVLSLDDLCYYHSYDGRGIASKMVIGEDGKPTCEYIQDDGTVVTGAYDCIPLMDQFVEEHPDAVYHGARGTVALTGYDGILGYRTDISYKTGENLSDDQRAWLNAHPDFDYEKECEEAKKTADAIKADGWTFASHTWGHIRVGDKSLEQIQTDTEKWLNYVAPLIGGSDIIIFAHGQDLSDWRDYSEDNEKFSYLKSKGFNIYCNVDSSQYFVQVRDNYLRMGRRNLDGYRLYQDTYGGGTRTADLFDAASVFDSRRPTDASLYDLQ
ncbi:MAG: polysaccharide deacetylase [Fusicatenibacter sp.]|nr:polysaccharide deacetylase [Fusicatenibacter sp.]